MPIENAKIPDRDIPGWIKALREGGLSDKEINEMLARKNVEYSKASGIDPREIEFKRIVKDLEEKHGRILDKEQLKYLKQGIDDRPEFKDFKDKTK